MKNSNIINFLFEIGILNSTPRSGFHFLGSGKQSLSEHILRTIFIGYTLASLEDNIDINKVIRMCLFHDLGESRTSDLNYVHQKYTKANEEDAIKDITAPLPFGNNIRTILKEYRERKTQESLLAKDADILEWILTLKEQSDIGNQRATTWIPSAVKRLKTPVATELAKNILESNSQDWWFIDKEGDWWINRNKQ